mmetsp:Transcript_14017/g.19467  ORF Transcript_14017/g.19467 Transcript_14017/m.19467 type:complete len:135 (-) Transcript_14017:435-839(-)
MLGASIQGKSYYACVKAIIKRLPNINITDSNGHTALIHAIRARKQDKRVIDALLSRKADVTLRSHYDLKTAVGFSKERYTFYTLGLQRTHRRQFYRRITTILERDIPSLHMLFHDIFEAFGNETLEGLAKATKV